MSQPDPTHNPPLDQVELTDGGSHPTATGQGTVSFVPDSNSPASPSSAKIAGSTDANAASQTRYEVHKHLGSGSFGSVSLAWDNQLQREVAIKRPRTGLPAAALQSFLREAQLVARLRHPSVVVVHDVQVTDTGEPFIVYEYLPGQSLRQRLKANEPLPLAEALKIALALAEGLAAAHKLGLTHRDLKPANVLFDAEGRPHIADFGLAIQEGQQRVLKGEIAGTFKYMAPEQVRGEAHQLDGRTDLWALGVILYEMLTGHQPFTGDDPADITDQILHRNPRPPRQWVPEIPKDVEQLVLKLLAKQVGERIGSASDVVELLCSQVAVTPTLPVLQQLSSRRIFVRYGLGAGIAIAGVSIGAGAWLNGLTSRTSKKRPVLVDDDFEPGAWTRLMEYSPPGITSIDPSTIINHEPYRLRLKSEFPEYLVLGRTTAHTFSYKIHLRPEQWSGGSGVFIGYSNAASGNKYKSVLLIGLAKKPDGSVVIERQITQQQAAGNQLTANIQQLHRSLNSVPLSLPVALQVDVEDDQVARIYVNGSQAQFGEGPFPGRIAVGMFGIYNLSGECEFTAPEFLKS